MATAWTHRGVTAEIVMAVVHRGDRDVMVSDAQGAGAPSTRPPLHMIASEATPSDAHGPSRPDPRRVPPPPRRTRGTPGREI